MTELLRRYLMLQDASEDDDLPDDLLDESIDLARELIKERLPEEAAAKVEVGLGADLAERFRRRGNVADIDAAIALGRGRISSGHALTWVTDRVNLAAALRTSWDFTDRVEHLHEAIEVLEAARPASAVLMMRAAPGSRPTWPAAIASASTCAANPPMTCAAPSPNTEWP